MEQNTTNALILDYHRRVGLPNVSFKSGNSLNEHLKDFLSVAHNKSPEVLLESIGVNDNSEVDNIINALASKITSIREEMRCVKDSVESLTNKAKELESNILATDPTVASLDNSVDFQDNYTRLDWDALYSYKSKVAALDEINDVYKSRTEDTNYFTAEKALNQLPFYKKNKGNYLNIELGEEKIKECMDILKNSLPNMSEEDIKFGFDCIISRKAGIRTFKGYADSISDNSNVIDKLMNAKQCTYCIGKVATAINKGVLEFSKTTNADIENNLKVVDQYLTFMTYYSTYLRNSVTNDKVIFKNFIINPDGEEALKANNVSIQDLIHYTNYQYGGVIPSKGIPTNGVIKNVEKVKAKVLESNKNTEEHVRKTRKDAKIRSFKRVSSIYANRPEIKASSEQKSNILTYVTDKYIDNGSSFEDAFYAMIIGIEHMDTPIKKFHSELEKEYLKLAGSCESLTAEVVQTAEVKVVANMVSKFIIDNFV